LGKKGGGERDEVEEKERRGLERGGGGRGVIGGRKSRECFTKKKQQPRMLKIRKNKDIFQTFLPSLATILSLRTVGSHSILQNTLKFLSHWRSSTFPGVP